MDAGLIDRADVEAVKIQDINLAFERVMRGEARCRYGIDMATLGGQGTSLHKHYKAKEKPDVK